MAKIKFDGVLEAAHFNPDGQLVWVRVYKRENAGFTDRIILSREEFIKQLEAGKRYVLGERILNMGGTFTISQPVNLIRRDGKKLIVVGDSPNASQDDLKIVPII
jgi:hypothetical protein